MTHNMKQVIVVRTDLNMRKGKIASQVAHGSLGATLANLDDPRVKSWLGDGSFTKICLSCETEEELFELERRAEEAGIINCRIKDSGKTEFRGTPTNTVLAIGPDNIDVINSITGNLKLL